MSLYNNHKLELDNLSLNKLFRERVAISIKNDNQIFIFDKNKLLINFASNDYLGLTTHPKIKNAFINGVNEFGVGSGSSPLVSGYYKPTKILEEKFAEFFSRDKAILFNSGYHANIGVVTTFASKDSTIIADKLCHASLIDGILLSKAKLYRYKNNDLLHAKQLLENNHSKINFDKLLFITESVFSMEGRISNIRELVDLASSAKGFLIVDDAHGVGVLGKNGGGICEYYLLSQQDVPILITPLGKAFGGMGAVVSGSKDTIEMLTQFARPYMYSTAQPPAMSIAMIEALNIIQTETWRREKLKYLIDFFIKQAAMLNLPLVSNDKTPIKSVLIGDNDKVTKIQELLAQNGFFVSAIRPPTVPKNTARIRISLTCMHDEKQISDLLENLALNCEKSYAG